MTITPDTKDWTWTIDRACPDCGFDGPGQAPEQVAAVLREHAGNWPTVLGRPDAGARPNPQTWSPLEYACHLRDLIPVFDQRVQSMLAEDDPAFANWDGDATAVDDDYSSADPAAVAVALVTHAEEFANTLDRVPADGWQRSGQRSNGATFTVASISVYFAHEIVHHGWDVRIDDGPDGNIPIDAPIEDIPSD